MPQGRKKTPFSGKAKKQQMQAKKQRKNPTYLLSQHSKKRPDGDDEDCEDDDENDDFDAKGKIQKLNKQPRDDDRNRYTLQFFQESKKDLMIRKEEARKAITPLTLEQQEVADNFYPPGIDMPKRPPWEFNMSKCQLDARENKYFTEYIKNLMDLSHISYFELNLETWRQLWRVLEMSDILLTIVDIRYPVLMFPPYLYNYITDTLKKNMILVLNKIDLVPASLVIAWKEYFNVNYPKLIVIFFTSYPSYNLRGTIETTENTLKQRRRKGKQKMAAEGAQKLLEACKIIVQDKLDLSCWEKKIAEEINLNLDSNDYDDTSEKNVVTIEKIDTSFFSYEKYQSGILTIGCIGTPNVGKSSFINAVMGHKVVSVSRTPGHTKHFQTIFLTKNVRLCDCPGLVFPSTVPKQLQILMGSFPIAQVREPYSVIKHLAERINLPALLNLQHQDNDDTWSAMDICDAWAAKRHYMTAKTARLDTYRAANSILRMTLEGKICLSIYPVGWSKRKDEWERHPDIEMIRWIQNRNKEEKKSTDDLSSSDEEQSNESNGDNYQANSNTDDDDDDQLELPSISNKFIALSTE